MLKSAVFCAGRGWSWRVASDLGPVKKILQYGTSFKNMLRVARAILPNRLVIALSRTTPCSARSESYDNCNRWIIAYPDPTGSQIAYISVIRLVYLTSGLFQILQQRKHGNGNHRSRKLYTNCSGRYTGHSISCFVTIWNECKETFFMRFALFSSLYLNVFCKQLPFERTIGYDVGLVRSARSNLKRSPYMYTVIIWRYVSYFLK